MSKLWNSSERVSSQILHSVSASKSKSKDVLNKAALRANNVAFEMEYSVTETVAVARAGMDEDFTSGRINKVWLCLEDIQVENVMLKLVPS